MKKVLEHQNMLLKATDSYAAEIQLTEDRMKMEPPRPPTNKHQVYSYKPPVPLDLSSSNNNNNDNGGDETDCSSDGEGTAAMDEWCRNNRNSVIMRETSFFLFSTSPLCF